jgi:ribonuclease P protein component
MTPPRQRATLSRRQRLVKTSQFKAVYAGRARVGDGRLVVYARPNGLAETRLGVSVGRRCGGSVQRNRVKRLLREAFRRARAVFPAGFDVVLVPLEKDYTFAEVDRQVRALVPEAIRRSGVNRGGGARRPGGGPGDPPRPAREEAGRA